MFESEMKCTVVDEAGIDEHLKRMLKEKVEKHFTCPATLVLVETGDTAAEVRRARKQAKIKVAVEHMLIRRAFELGEEYVEAVIEHEAKHLNQFEWEYTSLLAPASLRTHGREKYLLAEKLITQLYSDALSDAVAITLMSRRSAQRYLALICEVHALEFISRRLTWIKVSWMFIPALAESCAEVLQIPLLDDCGFLKERLLADQSDEEIYERMRRVFEKLMSAVLEGKQKVSLRKESLELAEAIVQQQKPHIRP